MADNWYKYYEDDIDIDRYIENRRKEYRKEWFKLFGDDEDMYEIDDDYCDYLYEIF